MFLITNDNTDAHLIRLQQQIDELRAEIAALKAAKPEEPASDRKEYMRQYMAKRRAEKKATR